MIISATERQTFARCRRKWHYSSFSQQSLATTVPRTALALGTVIHSAMAQWLLEPEKNLGELFVRAAADDQREIKAAYKLRVGGEISDAELAPFHEIFDIGLAMCKNYQEMWSSPLPAGFSLIQPETQFEIPIPETVHILTNRFDAIIKKDDTGDLYILDHKTYDQRPGMQKLQMDDQFLCYTWALQQANIGHVAGVAYDGLWRRSQPPRGRTFDDLFMRVLISRPQYEVDGFLHQLQEELKIMELVVERNYYGPTRRWEGCWDCNFNELCAMQSRGEDWQHYIQQNYVRVEKDKKLEIED